MNDIDTIQLPIKGLETDAVIPSYAYEGDAGLDLSATESCTLKPFERKAIPTKLVIAIPDGYAGLVIPRSGLALKHGISIVNTPGLIDSGYRGELKVILINLDPNEPFVIEVGDRIAQLMIVKIPTVQLHKVDELPATERGEGGFGSSGVRPEIHN